MSVAWPKNTWQQIHAVSFSVCGIVGYYQLLDWGLCMTNAQEELIGQKVVLFSFPSSNPLRTNKTPNTVRQPGKRTTATHYKQDTYTTNQPGGIKSNTPPPLSAASQSH